MPNVYNIGKLSEIKSRMMVTLNNRDIVIFRASDQIFAVSNVCSHQHFSKLHEGILESFLIECPMHGWRYDIRTGKSVTGEGTISVYPLSMKDGNLYIEVPDDD